MSEFITKKPAEAPPAPPPPGPPNPDFNESGIPERSFIPKPNLTDPGKIPTIPPKDKDAERREKVREANEQRRKGRFSLIIPFGGTRRSGVTHNGGIAIPV